MKNLTPSANIRSGFTLVEMMIVVMIIGILMAIAVPAVNRAMNTGRQTALRMEINSLSQAVERYMQKYGDYPPDGSNKEILLRHMRRAFPRMAARDLALLNGLTDTVDGGFSPVAMDRAEALVFFLGGFSDNPLHPLSGDGGPLTLAPGETAHSSSLGSYQYNATRENSFFDFDVSRLTLGRINETAPLRSTDETLLGYNDADHGGNDLLPVYLAGGREPTPILYFDSRSYGVVGVIEGVTIYNGFLTPQFGGVRPYKTGLNAEPPRSGGSYADVNEAFRAIPFHNPTTFQIISPGLDGIYGSIVSINPNNPDAAPVHFVTETGRAVWPNPDANSPTGLFLTSPEIRAFQDVDWRPEITVNGHLDNVTNFSTSTLENDLQ